MSDILDIVNKYWVQISFIVGAFVAIGEARFKVKDHSRRIENLEKDMKDNEDELKEIRRDISDKLEKIYTILIERK